jgi:ribose transport system substrate-binding protein
VRCKRAVAGILLGLGLLLLAGCNRQQQRRVAVIPKGTSSIFWQSVHAGAVAAGQDFKLEILWDGPPNETDYSRQLEIFDSMVNRHVDGIVVAAADRTTLNSSIDRAMSSKVPVVVFDSGISSTNYVSFVATNNYKAGQAAARKLAELIGGKGPIAMISHAPGSSSTMDRERGFHEVIEKEFPEIKIVAEQFSMTNRAKGMSAMENILNSHPELVGVFGSSEPSTVGASQALKSHGKAGKMRFVGFDSSDGLLEDLEGGTIDALMVQDPFKIGYDAVRILNDKLTGKTPDKQVDLEAVVVTKADLQKDEVKKLLHPDLKKYLGN